MHPLDNPVWESLQMRHAPLARMGPGVGRYRAEVAPFVAVASAEVDVREALSALVDPDESVLFVGPCPRLPTGWIVQPPVPIAQMISRSRIAIGPAPSLTELTTTHLDDMLALTALVYPHYFRRRTPAMGRYLGIYDGPALAAMAGERMGFDGHQEISAVCTHPAYTGRGYAQRLVAELTNAALGRGDLPFLHVSHQNVRAKALYQRLGYVERSDIDLWEVQRPPAS
jgi:ribosomal protein S18 acetylase RimI-like enzyme